MTSQSNDRVPTFSPDGRQVAFTSDRDGGDDLYLLTLDRGSVRRLTAGLAVQAQPSWSPDGRALLVSAMATGVDEIYSVPVDGSPPVRLTRGAEGRR